MRTARNLRNVLSILLALAMIIVGAGAASHRATHVAEHIGAAIADGHEHRASADATAGRGDASSRGATAELVRNVASDPIDAGDDAPCETCPLCLALAAFVLALFAFGCVLALLRCVVTRAGVQRACCCPVRAWPSGGLGSRAPPLFAV